MQAKAAHEAESEEEKKAEDDLEEPERPSAIIRKAVGLQKPPGAARRLKAPPANNLHQLRSLREKLQNKTSVVEPHIEDAVVESTT